MKCKQCDNNVTGRQVYCGPKCKQVAYRNSRNAPTVTKEPVSVTSVTVTPTVTVSVPRSKDPAILRTLGTGEGVPDYGGPECECKQCQAYRIKGKDIGLLNHWLYKQGAQLSESEVNRVSLPGDADYGPSAGYTGYDMVSATHGQSGAKP